MIPKEFILSRLAFQFQYGHVKLVAAAGYQPQETAAADGSFPRRIFSQRGHRRELEGGIRRIKSLSRFVGLCGAGVADIT